MKNTVAFLILGPLAVVFQIAATSLSIDSAGGHEGDEINIYCNIRNHDGQAEFFRYIDGEREFISTADGSNYGVYRCDKTSGDGVPGEDSVLTIRNASVADSGTYGCVPKASIVQFEWGVSETTNITVRSACSDHTNQTDPSKEQDRGKQVGTDGDVRQVSSVVYVLAILLVLALVALCVALLFLYRGRQNRGTRDGENAQPLNDRQ